MHSKTSPIGIIDSGIGGYSVTRRVQSILPHEDLLYLGDGANNPYGNHTEQDILTMTRYMLRFMEEKQVKILLVACNTISCLIRQYEGDMSCPVLSVVQAGADAVREEDFHRVGVISTVFTARHGSYPRTMAQTVPEVEVVSHGCKNLASMVERHAWDPDVTPIIDAELKKEFNTLLSQNVEACVLGCTHFPLVEENIRRLFPDLYLIDPALKMAQAARGYLEENGLLNDSNRPGRLDIYTTSSVEEYTVRAARMGLRPVSSVQFYPPMRLETVPARPNGS